MTPLLHSPTRRSTRLARWIGATAASAALAAAALACDACNLAFAREVAAERADTVVGADLRRAMQNQQGMRLDGYADPVIVAAQMASLSASEAPPAAATAAATSTAAPAQSSAPAPATAGPAIAAGPPAPVGAIPASRPTPTRPLPPYMAGAGFIEILERDYALPVTPYSTVPQDAPPDHKFTLHLNEGSTYIGNGIVYEGFLMNGSIPGPTLVVDVGDVVEMEIVNDGTIPHGASIHAAYTQTSKYVGKIDPGKTKSVRFRAMMPGVYMYHCAPGGHAIGMHVLGGQYGMIVVEPPEGSYELERQLGHRPNLELFLIQHELYASGRDAIRGDPEYVLLNGRTFRYIEEPLVVRPGDYVRINFLNVGPNILSTFHIVGIIWDYVYWQGNPDARLPGGQSVTAGPTDSFVIEFRMPPDEGAYTMLTHAVGSTNRGAIGLLVVDSKSQLPTHRRVLADGPAFNAAEMAGYTAQATRRINPFGIGTHPLDQPVVYGPETREVRISIIGNSYWPKVVQVAPGTRVTWTNEDVFTYLGGEYAGIHNAVAIEVPEGADSFGSPLLAHGESWTHTFDGPEGTFGYNCQPHPYMRGQVIVKKPAYDLASAAATVPAAPVSGWLLPLVGLCLLVSTAALALSRRTTI